jgi:hypothetical protein
MKTNNIYFKIKAVLVALLLFYLFLVLGDHGKDVDFSTVQAAMANTTAAQLTEQSERTAQSAFDGVEDGEVMYYAADSMMDVSELFVVKSGENTDLDAVEEAVNTHVSERLEAFRNYGTNQADLLEHAIVEQKGDYLFFAVSEDADQWEEVFLSCMK